ncbi:MAG: hypothetical protein KDI72_04960, partial [Xanthomonadales bacterium]|nr:hypothetical protein [Xanthomonadales bacterium]
MVDAIAQGVAQHDLGERHAAAPGLDAPANAARAETVFEDPVEIAHQPAQGFGDGLADDRPDHRKQGVDDARAVV